MKTSSVQQSSVGMIGLGIMGSAMSANLMKAGYAVLGYDVLARCRQDHRRSGGTVVGKCGEIGKRADVVVSSLPSAEALLRVVGELAGSSTPPRILVETSTLPLPVKEEARRLLGARGVTLLDCPVSGSGAQARAKDLAVYASGDRAAYHQITPILEGFCRVHYYVGSFGAGTKVKFVANLLVAIHNVAAAEAFVLAMKAGLDPEMVLEVIGNGAGSSRMFQVRGPMMVEGDYSDATIRLEVFQKDMRIIADFARELECPTPLFAASAPIYTAATAMSRSADPGAVCAVLEGMANYQRPTPQRRKRGQHRPRAPKAKRG